MLFGTKTAAEKRADFRTKLASGKLLQMPGAHEPIIARLIEEQRFDGIYISGGALSAAFCTWCQHAPPRPRSLSLVCCPAAAAPQQARRAARRWLSLAAVNQDSG